MISEYLASEPVQEALKVLREQFPLAIWETVYVTVLSTFFATIIGLPSECCLSQAKTTR